MISGDTEIEISDEDAEKIVTVQDAIDYLQDHGIEDTDWIGNFLYASLCFKA